MDNKLFQSCLEKYIGINSITWDELAKNNNVLNGEMIRNQFKRLRKKSGIENINDAKTYLKSNSNRNNDKNHNQDKEQRLEDFTNDLNYFDDRPLPIIPKVTDSEKITHAEYRETTEIKEDGSVVSDRLIEICEADSKSPVSMLIAHKFDPIKWDLVSCKNNLWNTQGKGGTKMLLYQSKITVKPKVKDGITFEDIDEYFKTLKPLNNQFDSSNTKPTSRILEIDIADLHIGNLAFPDKPEDVEKRMFNLISDILYRINIRGLSLEKILLVNLGDLLHYDTYAGTTTSGTKLTMELDPYQMFDKATTILISAIERLMVIAPVEFISLFGNHDRTSSYFCTKAVQFYFRNATNVVVDSEHLSRKYIKFGNVSLGLVHGDLPKGNIATIMQREARKDYGDTTYSEIHLGHIHSQQTLEKDGVILRYLPTLAYGDSWHYDNGYTGGLKTSASFLWDKEYGLQEIWYTSV